MNFDPYGGNGFNIDHKFHWTLNIRVIELLLYLNGFEVFIALKIWYPISLGLVS